MSLTSEEVPVRIIKRRRMHGGHHGGAWKVAYADFVTAMMALFIVLWIVGQSKEVKEYVAGYFTDPGAFMQSHRGGAGSMIGNPPPPSELPKNTGIEQQQDRLKQLGEEIMQGIMNRPELAEIASQVTCEIVDEGMRIELVEKSDSFFFDVGTSEIKPGAASILSIIAVRVGELPNRIAVEGHTDSRQYARSDGYTNFELSADRANSARRILVRSGVPPGQIDEVRGYADTRLRNRANPFDLTNRRISVLIKFRQA